METIHNPEVCVEEDDHQSKERRCKKPKQVHCVLQTLPRKCTFDAHKPTKESGQNYNTTKGSVFAALPEQGLAADAETRCP